MSHVAKNGISNNSTVTQIKDTGVLTPFSLNFNTKFYFHPILIKVKNTFSEL